MLCVIEKGLYRPARVTSLLFPSLASRTDESGRDGQTQAIQHGTDGNYLFKPAVLDLYLEGILLLCDSGPSYEFRL